jgi:thiamine biosynthesis lipoprotein
VADRGSTPAATAVRTQSEVTRRFRSMASQVTLHIVEPSVNAHEALAEAQRAFEAIAVSCTRFDPDSALMRANAAPRSWQEVPRECFEVMAAAHEAHLLTEGRFDPRVLRALESLGYDRSLDFAGGAVTASARPAAGMRRPWQPDFDPSAMRVRLGRDPIDLGGIGKGFAVRRALKILTDARVGAGVLVEAGGDLATSGLSPVRPGEPTSREWRAAVENPFGDTAEPVAVLNVSDAAAATTSLRLRSWLAGERRVHHIIDPRSGEPANSGLQSVTVVHDDPMWAEVWSKVLFLTGRRDIRAAADDRGLSALWVTDDGRVAHSRRLRERLMWQVSNVE